MQAQLLNDFYNELESFKDSFEELKEKFLGICPEAQFKKLETLQAIIKGTEKVEDALQNILEELFYSIEKVYKNEIH